MNLEITKSLGYKFPDKLYLLNKTDIWNKGIFFRDNSSQRHSEGQDINTLLDSLLGNLFSQKDKNLLYSKAIHLTSSRIRHITGNIHLINSFNNIPEGFFFSITEPAYHKIYCLINLTVYFKDQRTKSLRESYFGEVLYLYKSTGNNLWILVKKANNLLL